MTIEQIREKVKKEFGTLEEYRKWTKEATVNELLKADSKLADYITGIEEQADNKRNNLNMDSLGIISDKEEWIQMFDKSQEIDDFEAEAVSVYQEYWLVSQTEYEDRLECDAHLQTREEGQAFRS